MRKLLFAGVCAGLGLIFVSADLAAQTRVEGYTRRDGTYVQPHMRTAPNDTKWDNYSTKGNVNPYTGKPGTVNPYATKPYGSRR